MEAPEGYALDPTPHSVYVDVTDGDKQYTVSASNSPLPSLKITKADAQTFAKVKATFLVESLTGNYSTTVTVDGSLAAHYENTILITEGEPELLTPIGDSPYV